MPSLRPPTRAVHASFLTALAELAECGFPDRDATGLTDPGAFAAHVARLRARARRQRPDAQGRVPATVLWWVDGRDYLGEVEVRHGLTPGLRYLGGHIGFAVRPSARRRGHATAMLRAALPCAARLGIDPALLTCEAAHPASRRVIEAAGGRLADEEDGLLRFWLPTT